ncbi:MAG TPA: hypothetical protein VJ890_18780 [Vineibacter sp.]|nr:hypothetical protein [Vineibacter sp.]
MMARTNALTVAEALAQLSAMHGLSPEQAAARTWTCGIGPIALQLPNFEWRRRAIARHDIHHVLTGYTCSLRGEMEMAAWEFAAGRYPGLGATLFCLPLVAIGGAVAPSRTLIAYLRGRRGRTLYEATTIEPVLAASLIAARAELAPAGPVRATAADIAAFVRTVLAGTLVLSAPAVVAILIGLNAF